MKKLFACLILTIIFAFTVSCQSLNDVSNSDIPMKSGIVNENFSMSVPEDYEETSSEYINKYFKKDNSASIIVTSENNTHNYQNARDYYKNAITQYQATFDRFSEISTENVTINRLYSGLIAEFSYQINSENGNINMTCYAEYILIGSTIYIVTCSAPTETYQNYKDDFIASINSVSISQ